MKTIFFLSFIIPLKVCSQECHSSAINFDPKEPVGNYLLYEFIPMQYNDSTLLMTGKYDESSLTQTNVSYVETHPTATTIRNPEINKITFDAFGNMLSYKIYGEGKTTNGSYKYIGLSVYKYDNNKNLISENNYLGFNIPLSVIYSDSIFEQYIKKFGSSPNNQGCISKYTYEDGRVSVIKNYLNSKLTFSNHLYYTSGRISGAKAYEPNGDLFSALEFTYTSEGFNQILYFYSEKDKSIQKEDVYYFWNYKKENDRITSMEYGTSEGFFKKNEYIYDSKGRISVINMYNRNVLKYIHKYYYYNE